MIPKVSYKNAKRILIGAYAYQIIVSLLWFPFFFKDPGVKLNFWLCLPISQIGLTLFIFQLIFRSKTAAYSRIKFDVLIGILYLPFALFLYGLSFYLPIAFGHILASTKMTFMMEAEVGSAFYPYFFCLLMFDLFLLLIVNPSFKGSLAQTNDTYI
jgi:hypothetical protein